MVIMQTITEFHRQQRIRYHAATQAWDYKRGGIGFPCLAMYLFIMDDGAERVRGYVISKGDSHYFRLTKKPAGDVYSKLLEDKRI